MTKEDEFKQLFKDIEDYLDGIAHPQNHMSFRALVDMAGQKNPLIRNNAKDLKSLGELRNILSHGSKPIASPTDDGLNKLRTLCQRMISPPTALNMATQNVFSCDLADNISDVIGEMKKNLFTHVPAYKNEEFAGVVTESAIIYWLASKADAGGDGFITTENSIADMMEFIQHDSSEHKFVARHRSAFEVEEEFLAHIEQGKRLGAVFVTETGHNSEKLLGIITAWDLPRIKKYESPIS